MKLLRIKTEHFKHTHTLGNTVNREIGEGDKSPMRGLNLQANKMRVWNMSKSSKVVQVLNDLFY